MRCSYMDGQSGFVNQAFPDQGGFMNQITDQGASAGMQAGFDKDGNFIYVAPS